MSENDSRESSREQLQPGDRIYFCRHVGTVQYSCHGIYAKENKLINFDGQGDNQERVGDFSHAFSRDQLKPGDHIYASRLVGHSPYLHDGIYLGEGEIQVIHFSFQDDSRERVGCFSHAIGRDQLKPGDHIYAYRRMGPVPFAHHGIYVGEDENEVIHFSGQALDKSTTRITTCTVEEFCNGSQLRLVAYNVCCVAMKSKVNGTCHTEESNSAGIVLARARYFLNHPSEWPEYDLIENNCENFAFYCKTGNSINPDGQSGVMQGYSHFVKPIVAYFEDFFWAQK